MKAKGSVIRSLYFTLLFTSVPNRESSRFGIVVGRRVGKAVTRNRLKRIFRELVRETATGLAVGYHCIVYPKTTVLEADHKDVKNVWRGTLTRIGLL